MKIFCIKRNIILSFLLLSFMLLGCSKKESFVIEDIADVDGLKMGVMMGTTHIDYVKEDFPKGVSFIYDTPTDLLHALKIGKVDAAAMDAFTWMSVAKENPEITISLDNWRAEPFGMIFNKANPQILSQYNTFLGELKASGELQQIIDKWLEQGDDAVMPDLSDVKRSGEPLRVACTGTMAMFDFIKDGKNYGLDIEIIERFAAYLGCSIEYNLMNFGGLIASVSSDVADIASSSICITEERAKQVNFGDSYCSGYSIMLIRKENAPAKGNSYMNLDDLATATIATLLGSTQDLWIKENYKEAKQLVFNNRADMINALMSKQCQAMILDGDSDDVLVANPQLAVLEDGFCPVEFSVCFANGSPLLEQFNEFQRELKASGELDKMFDKWADTSRIDEHKPVIFEEFTGEPLKLGTTLMQSPYSYLIDGKPAGFDVELVSLFAKSIKRSVKVIPYDFGGLIPSLKSGLIDIIANSVMYTPERAKEVSFAEPYKKIFSCAIVFVEDLAPEHPNSKQNQSIEKKSFWQSIVYKFENNIIKENRWKLILDGLYYTVLISILSILFGTLLGVGVCAMRMNRNRFVNGFAQGYIGLVRGIPVLVLLMILFYVVFAQLGVNAVAVAIITFALNFAAYVSEMFRSGLESIDPGQRKAGIAMGFTGFQTFRYIILPQTVKRVLPVFKGEAISLVKTTSIVGYIAVADLTKASDIIRSRTFDAFFPLIIITIIYFVLAWLLGKGLDMIGKPSKSK